MIQKATDPSVEAMIAELEALELPSEDGIPLESNWHRLCMNLLLACVCWRLRGRDDFFAGGNMFIYFNLQQARNRDFRGPDFFFVDGVPARMDRPSWVLWEEGGRYPDAIIELSSPSTAEEDRTTKFRIYERVFRTPDYFIYDPTTETLDGWHLVEGRYRPLTPNDRGWLWCEALGLWVGTWRGRHHNFETTWLRFFDADGNLVPSPEEDEHRLAEVQRQRAEDERRQAEEARRQAEDQRRQAEDEHRQAEEARRQAEEARRQAEDEHRQAEEARRQAEDQRRRADAAEVELARLRELLARRDEGGGTSPPAP